MGSILILGPSSWAKDTTPSPTPPPLFLEDAPDTWDPQSRDPPAPIDVRAALVGHLRRIGKPATMMELHERQDGETNMGLFQRIEEEADVSIYAVILPPGTAGDGTEWELGALVDRMETGHPHDVRLFYHRKAADIENNGQLRRTDADRGTRYYNDLIAHGCPAVPWRGYHELKGIIARSDAKSST